MTKTRLSKDGKVIEAPKGKDLTGDVERIASQKAEGYCACGCFGAKAGKRSMTNSCGELQAVLATVEHRRVTARIPAAATLASKYERLTSAEAGAL
jgi:hypothetical protein